MVCTRQSQWGEGRALGWALWALGFMVPGAWPGELTAGRAIAGLIIMLSGGEGT